MKKIAFLVSSAATSGGIQKSLSLKVNGLDKQKYSITIISLFDFKNTKHSFNSNVNFIKGSLKRESDLKRSFFCAYKECNMLLKSIKFDTLVVEGLGLLPFIRKKYLKDQTIKIIVCDHTGLKNYKKYGLNWFGLKLTRKFADNFVVLTKENRTEYIELFKNKKSLLRVIPNAIDPSIKRSSYNYNSKKICFVGRLSREKGIDLLIKSFLHALELTSDRNWTLDIYGVGPEMNNLKQQIKRTGLENKVFLKGFTYNIYEIYKNYAFLVVPSRFESFGMIIIEALKAGIPVVAFDCKYGPKHFITNLKNGILVKENNVSELSRAMRKLMDNQSLRKRLAKGTSEKLEMYQVKKVVKEWEKIL